MTVNGFVGWGGKRKELDATLKLGLGTRRGIPDNTFGIRNAVWAAAMGYVSGYPKRDIIYYVLTRTLNRRVHRWALEREGVQFDANGLPMAKVRYVPAVTPEREAWLRRVAAVSKGMGDERI